MLTEQRSVGTTLLHVYVIYYIILKDFLIVYIAFVIHEYLRRFNMFCFILDNAC